MWFDLCRSSVSMFSWTTICVLFVGLVCVLLYKLYFAEEDDKSEQVVLNHPQLNNQTNKGARIQINPLARKVTVGNDEEAVKARESHSRKGETEFDPYKRLLILETIFEKGGLIYTDRKTRIKIKAGTPLPEKLVKLRQKLDEEERNKDSE